MKIVFVCIYSHPSICGVWSRVSSLGRLLIRKGHEVHVFSTNVIKGTGKFSPSSENYGKIKIHRFKPRLSFGENVKFWDFADELKKLNPDVIIAEVYRHPHTIKALKIARQLKKPCFLVTHAPFVEPELRSFIGNLLASFYDLVLSKKSLKRFDRIIAITKWEIPYLEKLGIKKEKIAYMPNGIPEEFFRIKRKQGKGILFLGRIAPVKNLETLISALFQVKRKYPYINLSLVGPAEQRYKQKLDEMIKKLGLERNIHFLKPVYNIKKKISIIDSHDIFVLPSKREAMPQSLIEAMARGKIAIASNNLGSKEIITNRVNGFLFPIGNSKKLARLIEFCLNKKLEKIRKNAVLKSKSFAWKNILEDFCQLLKKQGK